MSEKTMTLAEVSHLAAQIRGQVGKAIVGQTETVDALLVALLAQGHVLLEGPPGTAKTFLAQCFSASLGLEFKRIQFTPDLMPGDILGSNLFNFQTSQFTLTRGPIFTELLLADEINRTPPKTQAALLEAMQERRVTLDGKAHALPDNFLVVGTQNPIESQGVYPLPEAQLDRFLFKLLVPYPSAAEEAKIVATFGLQSGPPRAADMGVEQVADAKVIAAAAKAVKTVTLAESVIDYIVRLIRATRDSALPCCLPTPPGPAPRLKRATMCCPMMSKPSPRQFCGIACCCLLRLRLKASRLKPWWPIWSKAPRPRADPSRRLDPDGPSRAADRGGGPGCAADRSDFACELGGGSGAWDTGTWPGAGRCAAGGAALAIRSDQRSRCRSGRAGLGSAVCRVRQGSAQPGRLLAGYRSAPDAGRAERSSAGTGRWRHLAGCARLPPEPSRNG